MTSTKKSMNIPVRIMVDKEIVAMINKSGCFMAVLMIVLAFGVNWLISVGLVWLICLCFDWTFSWGVATGVWLLSILIRGMVEVNIKK